MHIAEILWEFLVTIFGSLGLLDMDEDYVGIALLRSKNLQTWRHRSISKMRSRPTVLLSNSPV